MMLVKVTELAVCKLCDSYDIIALTDAQHQFICGTYSSKEKALKVLDEIHVFVDHLNYCYYKCDQVYKMPADEKVKND